MEVFIAYHPADPFEVLEKTLEAWAECDGAEPIAIQINKPSTFEKVRRVTAESLADGKFYILADLGCVPLHNDTVRTLSKKLTDEHGLIGLFPSDSDAKDVPEGVRVCQKGIIRHWIPQKSPDYSQEHVETVARTGKTVEIWEKVPYKHIGAS